MKTIEINDIDLDTMINEIKEKFDTNIDKKWGEYNLNFNNKIGKGAVKAIQFDHGTSIVDFEFIFNQDTELIFKNGKRPPIEFIFITHGFVYYSSDNMDAFEKFNCYQNVILSESVHSKKIYRFEKEEVIKMNNIRIVKEEYKKKNNNNLTYLNEALGSIFEQQTKSHYYQHIGNFNLKIADQIRLINENNDTGIVRTLVLEGRLHLILAMQIFEQHNYETKDILPHSLTKSNITTIHELSLFIKENIAESFSVADLARQAGIGPKKLQLGFKVLFSTTVNEYIKRQKMQAAREYLEQSDYSISEIVYRIGLRSRSYFSKLFFEAYGILPANYRKQKKSSGNL